MRAPTIVVAAALVSDKTCVQVLGVEWRPLRRWAEERSIPIHKVGRRPCVRLDAVLAALDGGGFAAPEEYDEEKIVQLASRRRGRR